MICNMQARLVELKSNKALSVPREKMKKKRGNWRMVSKTSYLGKSILYFKTQLQRSFTFHYCLPFHHTVFKPDRNLSHYSYSRRNAETFWYGSHYLDILCLFLMFQWFISILFEFYTLVLSKLPWVCI